MSCNMCHVCGRGLYPSRRNCAWSVLLFVIFTVTNWSILSHMSTSAVIDNHVTGSASKTIDTLKMHSHQAAVRQSEDEQPIKLSAPVNVDNTTLKRNKTSPEFPIRSASVASQRKLPEPPTHVQHNNSYSRQGTSSYPRLSKDIITPQDFKLLLPGRGICGNSSLLFINLVLTIHAETEVRQAIRNTWGSYKGVAMRTAFLLGAPPTAEISAQIHRESAQYGDIVMADFGDTYTNLTYKVLMGLRWAGLYCHWAEFIVKADSDMFLNVTGLVGILRKNRPAINGTIYGSLKTTMGFVPRKNPNKWAVSKEMYPYDKYPSYMLGPCYMLTMGLAEPLYSASQHYPYLSIEDSLITGILAEVVGAQKKGVPRFMNTHGYHVNDACEFLKNRLITVTHVKPRLMYDLWSATQAGPGSCNTSTYSRQ